MRPFFNVAVSVHAFSGFHFNRMGFFCSVFYLFLPLSFARRNRESNLPLVYKLLLVSPFLSHFVSEEKRSRVVHNVLICNAICTDTTPTCGEETEARSTWCFAY